MILVVGGTGRLGGKIVELLRRDQPVRVMTRTPSRTRIGWGNLHDNGSLVKALRGADTAVCTAQGGEGSGANGPRHIEGAGIPRLIAAAVHQPLRQFVFISSASARPDSPAEFFRLKASAEQRLRASGIPYSILRPTHLMDTWVAGLGEPLVKRSRAMIPGSGRNPVSLLDTQPQVVDSTLAWQRLGIKPTTLREWLHHNAATPAVQWQVPASQAPSSAAAPSMEGH